MQGIVADTHICVAPGQTIALPAPPDTLGALTHTLIPPPRGVANPQPAAEKADVLPISGGQIKWTAPPEGRSEVIFVRHVFRSSPTRYINRADGTYSKDSLYSLIDYLNPDATRAFLKTTHEVYKQLFGQEFGKTVLGFFGDEPDYTGFIPWTPKLLDTFREQKGYDLQPYLPLFFAPKLTDEARRVKADYWDVWSGIFRESFFGVQADWCAANKLEYLVHLNHEELMLNLSHGEDLIRNEGDFFRDMRHVQIPGIDNLNQLVPSAVIREDTTLRRQRQLPEAGLVGGAPVRAAAGMGGRGRRHRRGRQVPVGLPVRARRQHAADPRPRHPAPPGLPANAPPQAAMLAWYTNRASYLMAIGRPAAQVALYHPANSMWLGDETADRSTTKLGKQLLEHQIDFDYFDEQSLSSVATLENGAFRNLSGQVYRADHGSFFHRDLARRAGSLARHGGRRRQGDLRRRRAHRRGRPDFPAMPMRSPTSASPRCSNRRAIITARVIAALPKPDVALDSPCTALKYTHRTWRDADLYFFFNESNQPQSRTVEVAGHGQAQVWDAGTGEIHLMTGATAGPDSVRLPLVLAPYEAKIVVIGAAPADVAEPEPTFAAGKT